MVTAESSRGEDFGGRIAVVELRIRSGLIAQIIREASKQGPPRKTAPFDVIDVAVCYSTISTIRRVRGSTRTVRPFTTV